MIPVLYRVPDWIPGLGGQPITSFGVMLLAAFLGAGLLFVRRLRGRDPLEPTGGATGAPARGWELVVAAAIGGIVGAKLLHLGVHWALDLPTGGLGRAGLHWFGGLVGGAAAAFWQADRAGIARGRVAGAAAPALALGYAIGRVGSFLVGADYGLPTALPWGVAFPAGAPPTTPANLLARFGVHAPAAALAGDFARVHPTQLYEAVLSLGFLYVLERRRSAVDAARGWRLLGLFLILHGCARSAAELLRAKQDHLAGPVTADLLLALAAVAVGVAMRGRTRTSFRATEPAA